MLSGSTKISKSTQCAHQLFRRHIQILLMERPKQLNFQTDFINNLKMSLCAVRVSLVSLLNNSEPRNTKSGSFKSIICIHRTRIDPAVRSLFTGAVFCGSGQPQWTGKFSTGPIYCWSLSIFTHRLPQTANSFAYVFHILKLQKKNQINLLKI